MFTPRLKDGTRLRIPESALPAGFKLGSRGLGLKGEFTDPTTGIRYRAYGASCGLPHCLCDAIAKPVDEGLVEPRTIYCQLTAEEGEPNPHFRDFAVGEIVRYGVAAPGIGSIAYRITRIDAEGAWGQVVENTVRELTAAEVR